MDFWQTERVRLRAYQDSDAEALARWSRDSERAWFLEHIWAPPSPANLGDWVAQHSGRSFENGDYSFIIEDAATGTAAGAINTVRCDARTGTFGYGLEIDRAHRRKGLATDAITLVLRYYFQECRYQKVTVAVHEDNAASIALHQGLGMTQEGRLRRMIYKGGRFLDEMWFGLTAEEFAARQ